MVHYFYFYVAEEDLHAVMVEKDNEDGTVCVRPVSAYYQAKTAKDYVAKVNAHIAARAEGKRLPSIRTNPPIEYRFAVPEWWTNRVPNWHKMSRVV